MPDQRVPDDVHVVPQAELDKGIGRLEVIAVGPFARMNELPLQIVLRRNLIELLLYQSDVLIHQLRTSATRGAGGDAAVDGHADQKMIPEG